MKNIICNNQGMWKFYYDKKLGICFYGPGNETPMILFDKGAEDFDVSCDEDGTIYLLCQDERNNIYLFYHANTGWRRQCILESKFLVPYDKNFSIIVKNGWINAFYTIRHSEKTLLIHHILNNADSPKVIESFDSPLKYTITCDSRNNIYCICQKESIGYLVYCWNTKSWQSFSPVQKIKGEICSVSAICDQGDGLHIVCSVRDKTDYSIYYISRNSVHRIYDGFSFDPEPVILCADKFYILFKANGRLMQCVSENPEEGFLKPSYYFPGSFTPHSLFKLSCQHDLRAHKIFAKTVYGTEPRLNSFEAAIIQSGIDDFDFSVPEIITEKTPDIENFVSESEPFPESDSNLEERVSALEQKLNTLLND